MIYVISLGGSIIVPGAIATGFLQRFRRLILRELKLGHRFFIVTGGGATARKYIRALRVFGKVPDTDLDWLGISATKMNAQLLVSIFGRQARQKLIIDPSVRRQDLKKINLVSGWKPGWSTDYVAVRIAQTYGLKTVVNLSNVDYVYDADPRKHRQAKKFATLSWTQFRRLFGTKWDPGANLPFDPVGAALADRLGIKVVVLNGRKLKNVANFLAGKKFVGTVIGN